MEVMRVAARLVLTEALVVAGFPPAEPPEMKREPLFNPLQPGRTGELCLPTFLPLTPSDENKGREEG